MIEAIIFDCFGVLTTDGWLPFKQQYFGHDPAKLQQAGDMNRQVDAGLKDYDEFLHEIAEFAGVDYGTAKARIDNNVANAELFKYIKDELKPHYKIGLLSNAGANWLDELFSKEQVQLFDVVSLSYETGVTKPAQAAYQAVADKLGCDPEACLFIDDQERYCTAASAAGMQTIWYQNTKQCIAEIDKLRKA